MKLINKWVQIELIEKSPFNKEPIAGKGITSVGYSTPDIIIHPGTTLFYAGVPILAADKYFIKEEQIIAYECN